MVVGHYLHEIPRCGASVCRKMASNLVFIIPKACWILECVLERWLLKWWAPLQRCGLVKLKVENNINIFYYHGMRWVILKNQHIWQIITLKTVYSTVKTLQCCTYYRWKLVLWTPTKRRLVLAFWHFPANLCTQTG